MIFLAIGISWLALSALAAAAFSAMARDGRSPELTQGSRARRPAAGGIPRARTSRDVEQAATGLR